MEADELKDKREFLGMTQEQLADALGVHAMTISKWERGQRAIPTYLELALNSLKPLKKKKR